MTTSNREYFINFSTITDRDTLHDKLQKCLSLPCYYGRNLDALHDCLTEMNGVTIFLSGMRWLNNLGKYGSSLLNVFETAAKENNKLTVIIND